VWDAETKQFAHPAGILVGPGGEDLALPLRRRVLAQGLRLASWTRGRKIGNTVDQVLSTATSTTPDRRYSTAILNVCGSARS